MIELIQLYDYYFKFKLYIYISEEYCKNLFIIIMQYIVQFYTQNNYTNTQTHTTSSLPSLFP